MKAIQKLLNTKTKLVVAILVVALLLVWLVLLFVARDVAIGLIKPILWALLLVSVLWLAVHFGIKAWRKRKRAEFDEQVAAKEGIEDRRKEWSGWTAELEKQGIDRYELPFYLLVGEPQSGKSVLLHNSDLHFPFGQNRLSGVGGTRGCDWWFTEEAVILDLAGRLFTHEGGAVDRLEFEAFLQLLYEFRPLCPANGVLLVIPCDSLLRDDEEKCSAKAIKIQHALLTLTTKLQAQLPVYLVLTKADQIFGFAECVHRLDVERRHQMFGWSRPADKLDTPFDLAEIGAGFQEMVQRSRLLRAHMVSGARLPEALPEVDRMYAFPHELEGLQPNLETYLKKIFTASNLTDRVLFRGVYLTSGLQSGVPIAKVCTDLFGQAGEADRRNLEALFSKQRAYFIKDLVRGRVFGERGLVRPTQGRVQQARRSSLIGYGLSGALVLASLIFAAVYLLKGTAHDRQRIYDAALDGTRSALEERAPSIPDLLYRLQLVNDAVQIDPESYEKTFTDPRAKLKELYCELFDGLLLPTLKRATFDLVDAKLAGVHEDHSDLLRTCRALTSLLADLDFSDTDTRAAILDRLPPSRSTRTSVPGGEELTLDRAFVLRLEYGGAGRLLVERRGEDIEWLSRMARSAIAELERCMQPGARTQPGNEFGYMLAWFGAQGAKDELTSSRILASGRALELSHAFSRSMAAMKRIEETLPQSGGGKLITNKGVFLQAQPLNNYRKGMIDFLEQNDSQTAPSEVWPQVNACANFAAARFENHEGLFNLSALGLHFGSEDFGQTMFQQSETAIGQLTGRFLVGKGLDYDPLTELDDVDGLLPLCDKAPPADLRGGGLAGLAANLLELHSTVLVRDSSGHSTDLFKAQCVELGDIFQRQIQNAGDGLRAVLGPDGGEAGMPPAGSLSLPLVEELADLHETVRKIIVDRDVTGILRERLRAWQNAIEGLLFEHLGACKSPSTWLSEGLDKDGAISEGAWRVLQILSKAAALEQVPPNNNSPKEDASKLQREVFFELAESLLERWQARPVEDLEETRRTVDELANLAQGVKTRLSDSSALDTDGQLSAWSGRVDTVLLERLGHLLGEMQRIWMPALGSGYLAQVVSQCQAELGQVQKKIDDSNRAGTAVLGPILKSLAEGGNVMAWLSLSRTLETVGELQGWRIPSKPSEVETDPEYKQLQLALGPLTAPASADEKYGEFLAAEYVKSFVDLSPVPPKPPANAGISLVRVLRAAAKATLAQEVRGRYLERLEGLFDKPQYRDLFQVLFWETKQEFPHDSDAEIQDGLIGLLDRKGEFFSLQKRFRLTGGEPSIGHEILPDDREGATGDWAQVHRFLRELQDFLMGSEGGSLRGARFSFYVVPRTGMSGTVWSPGSPRDRRGWFFYPGNDSSDDLQKTPCGGDPGRLRVKDWGFDVGRARRSLLFIWSDLALPDQARSDPNRYHYEVRSCLAPLLLAWSGMSPLDEERKEWEVSIRPERSTLAAPLRLQFDSPVPIRPPRP